MQFQDEQINFPNILFKKKTHYESKAKKKYLSNIITVITVDLFLNLARKKHI
jgi:hypothetical protein